MSKKNIIFMGTPEIAVPTLITLNEKYNIQAVVTVPDKPKGRGLKLQFSPIKSKAIELGLNVLQPEKMSDEIFIKEINNLATDIIVVFAFRILPAQVYNAAKIATFNIHTSLLPKYRGAAPINWAIINGEKVSGLTSFILQEKVDTGSILLQKTVEINENSTAGNLHDLLMSIAPQFAIDTCELLFTREYVSILQDNSLASVAPKIFHHEAKINWHNDAQIVANFINGYSPIPAAWTIWNGCKLKILHVFPRFDVEFPNMQVGEFIITNDSFLVKCEQGFIQILELQLEGKKMLHVTDFLNGYRGNNTGHFE